MCIRDSTHTHTTHHTRIPQTHTPHTSHTHTHTHTHTTHTHTHTHTHLSNATCSHGAFCRRGGGVVSYQHFWQYSTLFFGNPGSRLYRKLPFLIIAAVFALKKFAGHKSWLGYGSQVFALNSCLTTSLMH